MTIARSMRGLHSGSIKACLGAVLLLTGCMRCDSTKPVISEWKACLLEPAALSTPEAYVVPGRGSVLELRTDWGRPFRLSEHQGAHFVLELPAAPVAGTTIGGDGGALGSGEYWEGSLGGPEFRSRDLRGTLSVERVDAEGADLVLDIAVATPDAGTGAVSLKGPVHASRRGRGCTPPLVPGQ